MSLFATTRKFQHAVTVINRTDVEKLSHLVSRILKKLHLKKDAAFSEEEETQLQKVFKFTLEDVETLIEATSFIFMQTAYQNADAETLKAQLVESGVGKSHAVLFARSWASEGDEVVEKLKNFTLGGPLVLKETSWQLHCQLGQSTMAGMKEPRAIFQFDLADATAQEGGASSSEKLVAEFSRDELFKLYNSLETIQSQLDNLN